MDENNFNAENNRAIKPLARTVGNMKNTTTNIRGFADSLDHLLNAVEEFYPFIDKFAKTTDTITKGFRTSNPSQLFRNKKR